mmetsp:Transcript_1527/g.3148  ORF Transcript_1527/g.3148 Transcript_1527/m.3148 type:complete len:88 (+) Transcript_1527:3-266(+)
MRPQRWGNPRKILDAIVQSPSIKEADLGVLYFVRNIHLCILKNTPGHGVHLLHGSPLEEDQKEDVCFMSLIQHWIMQSHRTHNMNGM